MSQYYIASFVGIIHYVSDSLLQCDASTRIAELFCDEFDDVDFEMVLCCFEATHRVQFKEELTQTPIDQYEELSIEEFLENFLDPTEQEDPLFVTKRFRMFEDALTRAIAEEGNPETGM
jgi:hypothetical protein